MGIAWAGEIYLPNKYKNKRFERDGIAWDSEAEYGRHLENLDRFRKGEITNYQVKPPALHIYINGKKIGRGYRPDSIYFEDGVRIVEDVKSKYTRKIGGWSFRKAVIEAALNIKIREVIR